MHDAVVWENQSGYLNLKCWNENMVILLGRSRNSASELKSMDLGVSVKDGWQYQSSLLQWDIPNWIDVNSIYPLPYSQLGHQ